VNLASRNIDLAQATAAVTPKTRCCFPTHYNAPLDPEVLDAFAERQQGAHPRDAALAVGSRTSRGPVEQRHIVSFSFHPNKNMTTIEGGALALNDEREAAIVDEVRSTASSACPDGTRTWSAPESSTTSPTFRRDSAWSSSRT